MRDPIEIQETDALIMVDVQNDFCAGGALEVPEGDQVVEPLNRISGKFALVVATQDWHPPDHCSFQAQGGLWPPHCVAGTVGADFHPDLDVSRVALHVKKATQPEREAYSDFEGEPHLVEEFQRRGIKRVFVGGLATEYCVKATTLDALKYGFEAVVLTDAIRGVEVEPGDSEKALQEMQKAGAILVTTEDLQ